MIDGKALTEAIISKKGFCDSRNQIHLPHGVFTFNATRYAHVCFDRHPVIGRKCWFGPLSDLQIHILAEGIMPIGSGCAKESEIKNTGSGFLICPIAAGMKSFNIDKFGDLKENDSGAVELVKSWLKRYGHEYRNANIEEQKTGIDLAPLKGGDETWEVKCRFSSWDKIFVQLGETNPYKKF